MRAAKFVRWLSRFRRLQPQVGRLHAWILRISGGRIRRSFVFAGGQPVLALTTTGRRSGAPRTTTVAYLRHDDGYAVAGLNLGSDRDPAWCLNLRAEPRAKIAVAGTTLAVLARLAEGREEQLLWDGFIERLGLTGESKKLARREVPMWVLDPIPVAIPA
jgi:F420H(2)-dependent quinone reductase